MMIRLEPSDFTDKTTFQDWRAGVMKPCEGLPVELLKPERLCDLVYEQGEAASLEWLADLFAYNAARAYLPRLRKALAEATAAQARLSEQAAQAGPGVADSLDLTARGLALYAAELSAAINTMQAWTHPGLPWRKNRGDE